MRFLIIAFVLLSNSTFAQDTRFDAATGLEAGVARLSDGVNSLYAPSYAYHFDYQVDPLLAFFGQFGTSSGEEGNLKMKQTFFTGGTELNLLSAVGLRLGVASTASEVTKSNHRDKEHEMGPMVGLALNYSTGIWKLGTTATVIRTSSLQSLALRGFLFIEF